MAKIFGQPGSTKEFFHELHSQGVDSVNTLEDVARFKKNLSSAVDQIKSDKKIELEDNIKELEQGIGQLRIEYSDKLRQRKELLRDEKQNIELWFERYSKNSDKLLFRIFNWHKRRILQKRLNLLTNDFDKELKKPLEKYVSEAAVLQAEIDDKKTNTDQWIDRMSEKQINYIRHADSVISANQPVYYGAIGEERALAKFKQLPDSYAVINDFCKKFSRPVYDRKNDDRIYSIQVDHAVVGPTGIFIVETKNWSRESVNSLDLFSPVKQLLRSSFALFVWLNGAVGSYGLLSFDRHWGNQKISPKNIILMMNHKPNREYQYVKLCLLSEVNSYIKYGQKIFSEQQVNELTDFLIAHNHATQ